MGLKGTICAVIPAAGEGRRLGLSLPKIMVSVSCDKTVWEILHGKLSGLVDHIHVILPQQGQELFQKEFLEGERDPGISTSVQDVPKGMGDAIFGAYDHWKSFDHILVMWGDQVNVSIQTLQSVISLQKTSSERTLTIPVNLVEAPYVQYDFNHDRSTLLGIRESREGDVCDDNGFADVGVFGLSTPSLMESWQRFLEQDSFGRHTREINFLPFLVFLSRRLQWRLGLVEVRDPLESRGINTPEDLDFFRRKFQREGK